jgi:hypothetical protein
LQAEFPLAGLVRAAADFGKRAGAGMAVGDEGEAEVFRRVLGEGVEGFFRSRP